jgi:dihydroorotase-like cyclic amidohydrolase
MSTLFRDVRLLEPGSSAGMTGPTDVLVVGSRIQAVGPGLSPEDTSTRVIEGAGTCSFPV